MKNQKSFFLGMGTMLLIMVILMPIVSFAANGSISAMLSDIAIYVNNKQLDMTDENGNAMQPIIYNGRTYLPIKPIADAINLPVTWVAKTKSVYVGTNDLDVPATYLTDLDYFYSSGGFGNLKSSNAMDNLGNAYESKKTIRPYGNIVYNINGMYSKLKGACFLTYNDRDNRTETFARIYGDDQLLWSGAFKAGIMPMDFSLDISGCNQITLEIERKYNGSNIAFANLGLYP